MRRKERKRDRASYGFDKMKLEDPPRFLEQDQDEWFLRI
jgi:hypothetical protein